MKWEMEGEDVEVVLEKICDLHDRISDAIHALSRSHFLRSMAANDSGKISEEKKYPTVETAEEWKRGYVYVKGFKIEEDEAAIAEARSLNSIRTALEDLEEQLEFLHTVQSQQRAERDAAIARLEQSRIILAMRLADFHGRKYKVIEEAMDFVGHVSDDGRFTPPDQRPNAMMDMFVSSFTLVKKLFGLGNATLFTLSMLLLMRMKKGFLLEERFYGEGFEKRDQNQPLDVFSGRG